MPAKGYQFYEVDTFPNWEFGSTYETIHQDSLFSDRVDESPRSVISAVGFANHREFRKYHVMHETYKKVRGRYQNEPINGYIAQKEFHIYYHPTEQILFIDSKRSNCKELVDRLEREKLEFFVIPRSIDLIKLGNDLRERVRGGWFGNLKISDVSTIGLFGPTVGESAEWSRYEQTGSLSAIDLNLKLDHQQISVKIMDNRGVVLFAPFSESESLALLLEIQAFLDDYEIEGE